MKDAVSAVVRASLCSEVFLRASIPPSDSTALTADSDGFISTDNNDVLRC